MIRPALCAFLAVLFVAAGAQGQQSELRLDRVRVSLAGTHRHYTQYIDGIRVVGGERSETLLREGVLRINYDRSADLQPARAGRPAVSSSPRPPGGDARRLRTRMSATQGEFVYLNIDGIARPALRRVVLARALEPHAIYTDAETGALLRDDQLFYTVRALVFDVNPVARLNAPSLRDQSDSAAAVPTEAYSETDLPTFIGAGVLVDQYAQIVDIQEPFTPHADPLMPLEFNRSEPQFEEVNAYFQVDRAQRYLQILGFQGTRQLVAYSLPIDPHAANGTDNSYYLQGTLPGRGTLYFGDGGTDDGEDSDIVLHEFMHAVHDWIIPGALTGPASSQARAVSEALGDYWAFSSTYEATTASGRDPFCIGDWDARCGDDPSSQHCGYEPGADCLRRVDSRKTMADYVVSDSSGTEYLNGEIWASALREIFMALTARHGVQAGKRAMDTVVLESLFSLPPAPDFRTVARSMVTADRLVRGGEDVDVICAAMTARGIATGSDCAALPRGEWTLLQSGERGLLIPDGSGSVTSTLAVGDARAIERIAVRVDIAHPARGDVSILLIAPDGTGVKLKEPSQLDRTPDLHATFGIDAAPLESLDVFRGRPANGVWRLVVSDVYGGDVGALRSWGLQIVFAGDAAATIRPSSGPSRLIVPAVAHVNGASGAQFTSDLFLYNRGSRQTTVTAIFTPSGSDGRSSFGAEKIVIAPGQTIALRDLVRSVFATSGIGALELQTEGAQVVASSVSSAPSPQVSGGTVAQNVDVVPASEAAGSADLPLFVMPAVSSVSIRTNIGFVETAGAAGVVRVETLRAGGEVSDSRDIVVAPFSHEQIAIVSKDAFSTVRISVALGDARIIAYGSLVDGLSGDAMFLPARRIYTAPVPVTLIAAGHAAGIGGVWDTELWLATPTSLPATAPFTFIHGEGSVISAAAQSPAHLRAIVPDLFGEVTNAIGQVDTYLPPGALLIGRTWTERGRGLVGDRIPEARPAPAVDLLHVESNAAFRTNIGVASVDAVTTAVTITVFDASGRLLAAGSRTLTPRGSFQVSVGAIYGAPLTDGRVHVEATGGRIAAYASVVDNTTQDSVILEGR